jgi:hypothetical protein
MVFSQMKHLIKMANDLYSNATWSTTLCIYLLPIHPLIYLTNYLLTYYPPTHLPTYYLLTYLPTYLPIFLGIYTIGDTPIYNIGVSPIV